MAPPENRSDDRRRQAVMESALETFARHGFRGTSMESIAKAARISRPGLYFMFESKNALFRDSVSHVISRDLDAVSRTLADQDRPLGDRLVDAFDHWAGRYVGPMARDVQTVIADNPDLLDDVARSAPGRFETMITAAIEARLPAAREITQTLSSVSVGLIHQVSTREEYRERFKTAVDMLTR